MIRPICIKPSVAKPIAFAGSTATETTTVTFGPPTDYATDTKKLKDILALDVISVDAASSTQHRRRIEYAVSIARKPGSNQSLEITAGKDFISIKDSTGTIDHPKATVNSNRWSAFAGTTENKEVQQLIKDASAHVRQLYKQFYRQNNSTWERMRNLIRR